MVPRLAVDLGPVVQKSLVKVLVSLLVHIKSNVLVFFFFSLLNKCEELNIFAQKMAVFFPTIHFAL